MVYTSQDVRRLMTAVARIAAPLVLTLLLLAPLTPLAAQGTGRITGTVTDSSTGRVVSDVQVTVAGVRVGSTTDARGHYVIVGVPAGPRRLEARRIGFVPFAGRMVDVPAGGAITVDLQLREVALTLQAVVTTGLVDPTSGTRVPFTRGPP